MLYRLIDDNGMFVEDVLLDTRPTDPHYIKTPCPDGFYHPKWDGTQWVEGGNEPEPTITTEMLKQQLADTDYKIIKCYEYQFVGLDLPYDVERLHAERQLIRDLINRMEE